MTSTSSAADVARFLGGRLATLGGDTDVAALLEALHAKHPEQISVVLLYGSYLRGARDTLLDFYVVVDDYRLALGSTLAAASAFLMPPNVYYLSLRDGQRELRAKYAIVSRAQLQRQVRSLHPYFWARLTQPCCLVYARDDNARSQLITILVAAVDTFMRRVACMMHGTFTAADFWNQGFLLTYKAELRAEKSGRVASLFAHDGDYYTGLLRLCAGAHNLLVQPGSEPVLYSRAGPDPSAWSRWIWRWTIALGKLLSVARLVKAAVTFNDPIDYILWKIERHSGVRVEASERQRRYPLLFAWPLAWRLFRLGAFR